MSVCSRAATVSADRPDGRAMPLLLLPIVRPNQCGDLQLVGDGGTATATVGWVADVTGGAVATRPPASDGEGLYDPHYTRPT